jgi:plasmid stabilization system protein ParE
MPVIVSPEALSDLESIRVYLEERSPVAAIAITARLSEAMLSLEAMPLRGRLGLVAGTRELLNVPPYVITYRVSTERVETVRVWHIAQHRG